jgi:hypothetical protein
MRIQIQTGMSIYANADPHTEQVPRFLIRFRIQGFDDHKAKIILKKFIAVRGKLLN